MRRIIVVNFIKSQHSVFINSLSHEGRGITRIAGKTSFIRGALPGEEVRCAITKTYSHYQEGHVVDILQPSPERVPAKCAHFGSCGGCNLQHLNQEAQIQFKQKTLLEQIKHFGGIIPQKILPPLSGESFGYRRKARFSVTHKNNKVIIGFKEKSSHQLVNIEQCPILHPNIEERLTDLRRLIQNLVKPQLISAVETAVSDQAIAFVFHSSQYLSTNDLAELKQFGQQFHCHIYLCCVGQNRQRIWPERLEEKLSYWLSEPSLEIQFSPTDFIQVNGQMNQQLIKQALQLLAPTEHDIILDLFCGVGNFTLPLSRYAKAVVGVEGSSELVKRAEINAHHNQCHNLTFYAQDLTQPPSNAPWLKKQFDKVLLDPPRNGAREILDFPAIHKAKQILYISCNPATLARDIGILVKKYHYQLESIGLVNMFPHTAHIEAIALMVV